MCRLGAVRGGGAWSARSSCACVWVVGGVLLVCVPAIPIYITIEVKLLLKCNARLGGLKTVFSYKIFLKNRLNC